MNVFMVNHPRETFLAANVGFTASATGIDFRLEESPHWQVHFLGIIVVYVKMNALSDT